MASCPVCGTKNQEGARFCSHCGASLTPTCPRCGAETLPGARFCQSCGHALVAPLPRLEERKLVSVLFADVTGSTALSERLDPERLRAILADYFGAMAEVIARWGGSVEKFVGDAVMAAFGVPTVREDDAARALHAGWEMLHRLEDLNVGFQEHHGVTVSMRIGVNTGEVIAPVEDRVAELIVAGEAVNVAARLQAAAEPGTVLVGERTYVAARDAFRFGEPVDLMVKGKTEPVVARRLLGPLAEPVRGITGLRAAMVGREAELGVLAQLLEEVEERAEPRLALVSGPAGIGKSRMVWELVRYSEGRRPVRVLRGRCLSVGNGITYWALAEILRAACNIGLEDPADVVRDKLVGGLGTLLAPLDLPESDARETLFALATTAGIDLPDDPIRSLEPRAVAETLTRAWPRFLSALAIDGPILVIMEDLHWAGDQLVEMLGRIVARASGPIMFLATARPEFFERHPGFVAGREDVATVPLRPLSPENSVLLLEELLAVADLPAELRDGILERAEGNPFFLEEIIQRLIDQRVLVREGTSWRTVGPGTDVTLPDTVHGLLAARIDALPSSEKLVLQEAAVVGKVFWAPPVRNRLPEVDVPAALLDLESRGLIVARPTSALLGEPEYLFRHALIRDVAYAGLPRVRRAQAHAALAGWIQNLVTDRVEEFGELVAHHYWMAVAGEDADLAWNDDPPRHELLRQDAFRSLMEAGVAARRRYALGRALELHDMAFQLGVSDAERIEALKEQGNDHSAAYHGDEAVAAYLQAMDLAAAHPDLAARKAYLAMKASREAVMKSGSFRSGVSTAAVEQWITEGLAVSSDDRVRTWLLSLRAGVGDLWISATGEDPVPLAERRAAAEEALRSARSAGHPGLEVYAVEVLRDLLLLQEDYQGALALARESLRLVDEIEEPSTLATVLFDSALTIGNIEGDWVQADELARRSREVARHLSPHELMHATATLLMVLYFLGRWSEAIEVLEEHMAAFTTEGDVGCGLVQTGPAMGSLIRAHRGESDEARRLLTMIPVSPRISRFPEGWLALTHVVLGEPEPGLARAEAILSRPRALSPGPGQLARLEALTALQRWDQIGSALASAERTSRGYSGLRPAIERVRGKHLLDTGDPGGARSAWRSALETAEQLGMPFEAAQAREGLARAVGADAAAALLAQAGAAYEAMGARPAAQRVEELLTSLGS